MLFRKKEKFVVDGQQDVETKHKWWQFKIFDSHYKIERFGIKLLFGGVVLGGLFGYGLYNYHAAMTATNNQTAKYTTEFDTSRSKVSGHVVGIYGNKDHTKAFVLMRAAHSGNLPGDAKEFQFFLGGSNPQLGYSKLTSKPAGAFYMFGSTGYMGFYLVNKAGFKSQVLNLIGRINRPVAELSAPDKGTTGTFRKYDQFQIFFNPGATHVKNLPALDEKGAPSIAKLYNGLLLAKKEKAARKALNQDLAKMDVYRRQIQDRRHRLILDKVKPLPGPKYLQGDKIVNKHGQLYLKTKEVVPGGFNFDWQDGSVMSGYLNKIYAQKGLPANTDPDEFLMDQERKQDASDSDNSTSVESEDDNYMNTAPDDTKWRLFNGKPAIADTISDDDNDNGDENTSGAKASKQAQINNDIQLLENAWDNYIKWKQQYQTQDLEQLLQLESTYSQVDDISMINDSNKVLTFF